MIDVPVRVPGQLWSNILIGFFIRFHFSVSSSGVALFLDFAVLTHRIDIQNVVSSSIGPWPWLLGYGREIRQ